MKASKLNSENHVHIPRILFFLAFAALSTVVSAQNFTHTSSGGEITITGYTGPGGEVAIPDSIDEQPVVAIGNNAFYFKSSVTGVTMPDGLRSIGSYAFAYCSGLTSASIPGTVTNIGYAAFTQCGVLETISIPESVNTIGVFAFYSCSSMTSITVAEGNTAYSSREGVLYDKDQTRVIQCPGGKTGSFTLPETVSVIGNYSFRNCNEITDVEIGDNVTSIGGGAFQDCNNLETVVVGSGVTDILGSAFGGCTSLTGVYFKGDAPSLPIRDPWSVFLDCENATVYYLEGTSGWESTYGDLPTAIWVPEEPIMITSAAVVGGELSFIVTGAAGTIVIVEACLDLGNPAWSTVDTVTLTNGSATLSDPEPATLPGRYYRARTP